MADGINQMDEIDLNNLDFSESGDESSSSSESDNDPLPLRIHISNLWTATDDEGAGKSGYSLNDIFVVSDAYRTRLTNMRERFRVMMNNYLLDITRLLIAEANDDEDDAEANDDEDDAEANDDEDDAEANDDEDGVLWGHLERFEFDRVFRPENVLEAAGDPPIEAMVLQNISAIVNRWNHETDFFEVTTSDEVVGITYKAFSNYHDIIEELLDELKAKESELEAKESELEETKSIINAKNTELEKLTFLLEAKTSKKIVNKLPEELDKKIVKYLGGRKTRRAKKFLKLKTNKTNF